jgi:hypothetical protein
MLPLKSLFVAGLSCVSVLLIPSPLFSQSLDTRLSYFCSSINGSSTLTSDLRGESASVLTGSGKVSYEGPALGAPMRRDSVTQISAGRYQELFKRSPETTPFLVAGRSTYERSLLGSCTKLRSERSQVSPKKRRCTDNLSPASRRRQAGAGTANTPTMIKAFRGLCAW